MKLSGFQVFKLPASIIRCSLFCLVFGLWTLVFGLWTSSAAQSGNSGADYSNFEIIAKRNIFNPNRSRTYVRTDRVPSVYRPIESFALVGVMSYGKGPMAFFDGSRSDYKRVLKPNDTIGGFKVTAIDDSSVKLASSTNEIEFPVGMQMARENGGDWKASLRPESLESVVHDAPMRTASAVNAERASSNQNTNPFGNFFANGGFNPGGFNPGGFNPGNFNTPAPPAQPAPNAAQPVQSGDPNDILARLAARRAQETGESPPNQGEAPLTPAGQPQPGPNGQLTPNQQQPDSDPNAVVQPGTGQSPGNQQPTSAVQPDAGQLAPTQSPGILPSNQRGGGALPGQLSPNQQLNPAAQPSAGQLPANQQQGALPGQNLEQPQNQK